jgi:hypothetical protein
MKRYLLAMSAGLLVLAGIIGTTLAQDPPAPVPATKPAQQAAAETWPMPVEDFLAGRYLQLADVVLTRREWNVTSWVIRYNTSSAFSHAAMVFTTPGSDGGIENTFIIEASPGGVDLTDLREYLADKSTFVAIKRMQKPWFDEPKQSRVRGVLLDEIKARYSYGAIGQLARNLWFGFGQSVWGNDQTVQSFGERKWDLPNEFICSGLVQVGFYKAIKEFILSDQVPPSALSAIVFLKTAASRLPATEEDWSYFDPTDAKATAQVYFRQQQLNFNEVMPEDLATSDKLTWEYFIKDGLVHKVSSYDEVRKLIGG